MLIQARLNGSYTIEDCNQVIDNQVRLWQNDPKMQAYLRPQTLLPYTLNQLFQSTHTIHNAMNAVRGQSQ